MDKETRPLQGVLQTVIRSMSRKRPGEEEIEDVWAKAAGEGAARHSRPVAFRRSVLVVEVDTSGWLYELTTEKKKILGKLDKSLKGKKKVKDIRFRIAAITAREKGRRPGVT